MYETILNFLVLIVIPTQNTTTWICIIIYINIKTYTLIGVYVCKMPLFPSAKRTHAIHFLIYFIKFPSL